MVKDPGKIIGGPGRGSPPEFVKAELSEGWPSKWVGLEEAREGGVPDDALALLGVLDEGNIEGLLLPAVQKMTEHVSFIFNKITQEDSDAFDRLVEAGTFDDFDDLLILAPEGEQAGVFLKIGDVKGEAQDTPDMGAWTPLSDFSDTDLLL